MRMDFISLRLLPFLFTQRGRRKGNKMEITISKKTLTLNFGVRFVRELDKLSGVENNGIKFGMGVTKASVSLMGYDTASLADVLYSAAYTNRPRPSLEAIEGFIDDPETDLEKIFEEVQKELKESNATKMAAKNVKA